ncbi:MAG TPA: transposase [Dermatophilaceae bacterium]|nr:transposase [Dermatophilaceae bacterium]HOA57565.1 transposase [Dermatophilaceae bacterium]HPZ68467.1 transposase [Dermatophilaceae bacterium]
MPERTWRRWQARARAGQLAKGPWPRPARDSAAELARKHALAHPVWGHRKVWAMVRHDGHVVSEATILRLLRGEGLILFADSSGSAGSWPSAARPRSRKNRPARTRCGSWTSPSSRPRPVGRGAWQGAATTGQSTSTRSTRHRP